MKRRSYGEIYWQAWNEKARTEHTRNYDAVQYAAERVAKEAVRRHKMKQVERAKK